MYYRHRTAFSYIFRIMTACAIAKLYTWTWSDTDMPMFLISVAGAAICAPGLWVIYRPMTEILGHDAPKVTLTIEGESHRLEEEDDGVRRGARLAALRGLLVVSEVMMCWGMFLTVLPVIVGHGNMVDSVTAAACAMVYSLITDPVRNALSGFIFEPSK